MKKSNVFVVAMFMAGSLGIYSCGGENTESTEGTGDRSMEETSASDDRPSPLRTVDGTIGDKEVSIQYGAPSVKDRVVWGDIVPYNEVWRTGANEATFVDFSEDVQVEGQPLPAGKYSLFTIPKENGPWTVIFNSEWDLEHGHFQYKEENDVLRVESTPERVDDHQEQLTIAIESPGLLVRWEKMRLPITIQ